MKYKIDLDGVRYTCEVAGNKARLYHDDSCLIDVDDVTSFLQETSQEVESHESQALPCCHERVDATLACVEGQHYFSKNKGRYATVGVKRLSLKKQRSGGEGDFISEIESPTPAKIISIAVVVGAIVETDQELLVLEAMKMQTTITAPQRGCVSSVDVSVGDTTSSGALLIGLEPVQEK